MLHCWRSPGAQTLGCTCSVLVLLELVELELVAVRLVVAPELESDDGVVWVVTGALTELGS